MDQDLHGKRVADVSLVLLSINGALMTVPFCSPQLRAGVAVLRKLANHLSNRHSYKLRIASPL